MMWIDVLQNLIKLQEYCDIHGNCWSSCADQGVTCPATAFTAIGAAFATEGYWVQSNLIYYLVETGMGLWAPLLYIVAAFGGLMSLAIGSPPRTYMWFFMGPAIYSWLLDSRQPVTGVEWRVGDQKQDQYEVWKLSEPGLANIWYDIAGGDPPPRIKTARHAAPGGGSGGATQFAYVAIPFLWFDELISDTVQQLTHWFGVYDQFDNTAAGADTNLNRRPDTTQAGQWYLLSNTKWEMLWNITSAKFHSAEARDAFVTFLSSECGDLLKASIDDARLIAVSNAKGLNLDAASTIFIQEAGQPQYQFLTQNLMSQSIPTPRGLKKLLSENTSGSFRKFTDFYDTQMINAWGVQDNVSCDQYLDLLVQAFRWETGHTMNQLIAAAPHGTVPYNLVYNLLYGWDIKTQGGQPASMEDQLQYIENLILVHMIRNEMAIAPALVDQRYASSVRALSYTTAYQRAVGSEAKFAEVYTWAKMIPYLQGILLYLLAIAYPFACIVILIPGMHKAIFTWMSFWAWVKLWDLGFAIVMVLERSIWAMLGNNSNASNVNHLVVGMQQWGAVLIDCGGTNRFPSSEANATACSVPVIRNLTSYASGTAAGEGATQAWDKVVSTLDRALVLGANMDFDLANSYYIYIMSALYFAVPTVTGQLVLGARAGAAGMINTAIGGVSQEAGKMAGSGSGSEAVTQMHANMASVGQASYAKSLRQSGLGAQAIEYGNQGLRSEMGASALGTAASNQGIIKDQAANTNNSKLAALDAAFSNASLASKGASQVGALTDKTGKGALGGAANMLQNAFPGNSTVGNIANGLRTASNLFGAGGAGGAGKSAGGAGGASAGGPGAGSDAAGGFTAHGSSTMGGATLGDGINATNKGENAPGISMNPAAPAAGGGGGSSSASGGGGGGGGGGSGARQVGGGGTGVGTRTGNAVAGAIGAFAEPMKQAGRNQSIQNTLGAQSNSNGMIADMNIGSFQQGQYGKGYGAAASRSGQAANFKAEQDSWEAKNAFANQITGQAVALGHFVGGMSAGNKPTAGAEAMAMDGMLGSGAKNAANYVMPNQKGGFFDSATGASAGLSRDFGGDRVRAAYQSATPAEMAVFGAKAEATMLGKHAHGGGWSGNQIYANTNNGQNVVGSSGDAGRGSETVRGAMAASEAGLKSVGLGAMVPSDGSGGGVGSNNSGSNPTNRVLGPIR